jgi:hypothetical protein
VIDKTRKLPPELLHPVGFAEEDRLFDQAQIEAAHAADEKSCDLLLRPDGFRPNTHVVRKGFQNFIFEILKRRALRFEQQQLDIGKIFGYELINNADNIQLRFLCVIVQAFWKVKLFGHLKPIMNFNNRGLQSEIKQIIFVFKVIVQIAFCRLRTCCNLSYGCLFKPFLQKLFLSGIDNPLSYLILCILHDVIFPFGLYTYIVLISTMYLYYNNGSTVCQQIKR